MSEYITRAAAIDAVMEVYYNTPDINLSAERLAEAINSIPAADVALVIHGKWKGRFPYCSICGEEAISRDNGTLHGSYFLTDCCPHCGVKLDGGETDGS